MKIIFTTTFFALMLFCSFAQLTNETISIGGVSRTYKLYVPVNFDAQTEHPSMVIVMHGLGGTNDNMVPAGFNNIADTARIIVVYPQALNNAFGQAAWNNGTLLSSTADDLGFIHELINKGLSDYQVDATRVYATGFSMGSIMSHHLACNMNNRIAAIGAMAGTMSTSDIGSCVPAYKTPVIHLHGTADGTVPYGSNALPSLSLVPETIAFWRGVHGCDASADSTRMPDTAADGITVDRFVYDNCNPTGSLELWRLNGADHVYLYQPVNDITEMLEVWWFFRKWQHSNPTLLHVSLNEEVFFEVSPNPSTGMIRMTTNANEQVVVLDMKGTMVFTQRVESGENQLDLSFLQKGIYLLQVGVKTTKIVLN